MKLWIVAIIIILWFSCQTKLSRKTKLELDQIGGGEGCQDKFQELDHNSNQAECPGTSSLQTIVMTPGPNEDAIGLSAYNCCPDRLNDQNCSYVPNTDTQYPINNGQYSKEDGKYDYTKDLSCPDQMGMKGFYHFRKRQNYQYDDQSVLRCCPFRNPEKYSDCKWMRVKPSGFNNCPDGNVPSGVRYRYQNVDPQEQPFVFEMKCCGSKDVPPVVEPTPHVVEPTPSVVEPPPPVVEPPPPVVEPTPPVVEPTPPVVEPTPFVPPIVEPTPPVVEPTPPVVEPTPFIPPVVEPTPPVVEPTPPTTTSSQQKPVLEPMIPSASFTMSKIESEPTAINIPSSQNDTNIKFDWYWIILIIILMIVGGSIYYYWSSSKRTSMEYS